MATQPFPLSILADVTVSVTPAGVAVPAFNQWLVVGNSGRLPSYGANSRCVLIPGADWQTAMVGLGYQTTDPEYIGMEQYFAQDASPVTPPEYAWVGCQDPSAIQTIQVDSGFGGTGWAANDQFLIAQGGASYGYGQVLTETGGVAQTVAIVNGKQGTAYTVANGLTCTAVLPSVGVGLKVNVTAIGETPLQAVTSCRVKQPNWYLVTCLTATDSDNIAITEYAQSVQPAMQNFYQTSSVSALFGLAGNIFTVLKTGNYNRGHGLYATTQGGSAPLNAYQACALAGVAMGLNTGLANSNFSLAAKTLVGQTPVNDGPDTNTGAPLTFTQINTFAGTPGIGFGNNGNSYNDYAASYSFYYQGVNANGLSFTTILGLDMLAADCQISILNVLQSLPSIPQTDPGQALVLNAVRGACARSANRGFIAAGTWNGKTIPTPPGTGLTPGTALTTGYWVASPSFSTQSPSDRALFKSMPVYVAVVLAGTQQSFLIAVNVQQ